jgi:hypothetical protein
MPKLEIPKGIIAKAAPIGASYALLIFLDRTPYIELTARKHADFLVSLAAWKKTTLATLKRSDVRFFIRSPGDIKELTF